MTRPTRVSGRSPVYTQEAIDAGVEGLMIVKCLLRESGEVTECRIIKPLPYLEQSTLDALKTWCMTPVLFKGRPVAITYVFPLRFKLPSPEPPPVVPAP
ncbi:energy transducer TonB [Sorangium cellulosum]|uniref:energy transducer TonB n=1 Tax=Sorangium cellulosum TaxID=56 RepID=UPI003D9A6757